MGEESIWAAGVDQYSGLEAQVLEKKPQGRQFEGGTAFSSSGRTLHERG